jgi:glycosyltransferase involved in cell wall biosynthesis
VLYSAEVTACLEQVATRSPVDLVYERYALFSSAGVAFARRHGLPHVLEVNAPLVEEAQKYRTLVSRELAKSLEALIFSHTDHAVAVSEPLARYVRDQAPRARVSVVPNGVNLERFASVPTNISDTACSTSGEIVIGFVGTVRPWHGVDLLVKAFAQVVRQQPQVKLRIIGDHTSRENELAELCARVDVKDAVEFTGAVDADVVPTMLSELDVVVAPYPDLKHFYFSPLKIFEYMAAGKAIVASSIGQIDDVLEHERTALLVSPGDVAGLTGALLRMVQDHNLRQRLSAEARVEAVKRHGWPQRIETVLEIMKDERRRQSDVKRSSHALEV